MSLKRSLQLKSGLSTTVGFIFILFFWASAASSSSNDLHEAKYYLAIEGGDVQCLLCPRECYIKPGERGTCGVRENREGRLYSLVYGKPCAVHVDPIEKKPLFHMLPGSGSFSMATAGCNLRCINCQNWTLSQRLPEEVENYDLSPSQVVELAKEGDCKTIAYTYNEPTVFFEYMLDTAKCAHKKGLRNLWITSGYINAGPSRELCKYLDAANVDLKGFTEQFYRRIGGGKLEPVLKTLKILKEEGVWLEVTNLIIPTFNDDLSQIGAMCEWIKHNLGPDIPLHFSRFFPAHKLTRLPPTPVKTLEEAREVALKIGLHYVYVGNVPGHPGNSTYCPRCGKLLIQRVGFIVSQNNIVEGHCKFCGEKIPGVWD